MTLPFWQTKNLAQMTPQEWESLCDGCGLCCVHKGIDDDTDELLFTRVACHLLDPKTCRCSDYPNRTIRVPGCVVVAAGDPVLDVLPPSCAYRRLDEGRGLAWWHPLRSGTSQSVRQAGVHASLLSLVSELEVEEDDFAYYLVDLAALDSD